eukprot:GHVT01022482.1.p2 GENE.GHVT01022482.1~~GHVT01022482.1.p2  ORF type:complete len:190 (-),score=11.65 GHVT01022482.1:1128-1697(-)
MPREGVIDRLKTAMESALSRGTMPTPALQQAANATLEFCPTTSAVEVIPEPWRERLRQTKREIRGLTGATREEACQKLATLKSTVRQKSWRKAVSQLTQANGRFNYAAAPPLRRRLIRKPTIGFDDEEIAGAFKAVYNENRVDRPEWRATVLTRPRERQSPIDDPFTMDELVRGVRSLAKKESSRAGHA